MRRPGQGEAGFPADVSGGEHRAGVLVGLDRHPGLEAGADDPQPLIEIDLEQLQLHAFDEVHEGKLVFAAVNRPADFLYGVDHRRAPLDAVT